MRANAESNRRGLFPSRNSLRYRRETLSRSLSEAVFFSLLLSWANSRDELTRVFSSPVWCSYNGERGRASIERLENNASTHKHKTKSERRKKGRKSTKGRGSVTRSLRPLYSCSQKLIERAKECSSARCDALCSSDSIPIADRSEASGFALALTTYTPIRPMFAATLCRFYAYLHSPSLYFELQPCL